MVGRKQRGLSTTDVGAADTSATGGGRFVLPGVITCFLLSGFAALLYQTAWLRQFSLVFGTSELAVATVLAAYMGGLAAGAAIAGRYVTRVRRPILVYGVLEAGIAISALAVPLLLAAASALYASILGDQPNPPEAATIGQPIFYLFVAFVVLALPTGFMGATLPLLTRYAVRTDREVGPRVALLYATNTAGAVFGTVVAAFVLLPALGLIGTVWVGVAINGLIFIVAALLAQSAPKIGAEESGLGPPILTGFFRSCVTPLLKRGSTASERLRSVFQSQPGWILPLMLVSGASAFTYEVLWTRMLTHVIGGSIYAFATMLAAFLTGIALGGGLAGKVAEKRELAAIAFAITQAAIATLSAGIYAWMGPLIPTDFATERLAIYAIIVMLPATIFIGATFPLAVRILVRDEQEASAGTARIYSWNTLGAIAGAILAGFFLIPELGFEGSIRLAVSVNLGLALWAAAFVAKPKLAFTAVMAIGLLATLVAYHPNRPQAVISSTGFALDDLTDSREIFYRVGRTSTVMLLEHGGHYFVRTNGLPEASIAANGAPPFQDPEKWLTALPVSARPDIRDMLVIGFGGGVALEGIPSSVDRVDVIELEPEVINANRALAGMRNIDPLMDSRISVIINDARNALRLSNKTYDAIVSQPSHPWTAGASHLFTREFVADAKSHLDDDGVFVQWMNSEFVDEPLLRTLAATLLGEFEHIRLYHPASQVLMFMASDEPLETEVDLARTGRPFTANIMHYSRLGMNGVEDLLAAMAMDQAGVEQFAQGTPISTDNNNLMATQSRSHGDGLMLPALMELFEPYDPLSRRGSWIYSRLGSELDYGYMTRRLVRMAQYERAARVAELVTDPSTRFEIYGQLHAANGRPQQAKEAFMSAVATNPANMQARYRLIRDHLDTVARGEAPDDIQTIAAGLSGPATAVVIGWSYGAAGDWASLAQLDAELARSRITDVWYPDAARLRAEWRTNVAQDRERFAFDALRLIDRALLLAPDQNLYLLRAASGIALQDDDLVLESSRYIAANIRSTLSAANDQGDLMPTQELAQMKQNLVSIDNELSSGLEVADPGRLDVVLREITSLIESIDAYPISEP